MMTTCLLKRSVPIAVMGTALGLLSVSSGDTFSQEDMSSRHDEISFRMVRSAAAEMAGARCLSKAHAQVTVRSLGTVEVMDVEVGGLPANTDFDFFVIQVPNAPFGLSWYQGDIETDEYGRGSAEFIGRFSIETFIVAPGVAKAPVIHKDLDASTNPATLPVHTHHLGLWFNSPKDADAAGCGKAVTPFNGDHNAGVQVLSTRNFPNDHGPLRKLRP